MVVVVVVVQTMLLNNLSMAIPAQNPSQGLAIQLPTTPTNAGTTMITTTGQMTHQTANQPTPVKGHSNQTTIMKGVTISPQQNTLSTQANKTNASTNATKTQQQHHQLQSNNTTNGKGNGKNHQQLKTSVDEEYRRWKSITNDNDRIKHFPCLDK